jgi:allophanate hydrolase subunit 2
LRVVLGPDLDVFDRAAVDALMTATFVVDARSDRVGTRLTGPRLDYAADSTASGAGGTPSTGISAPMVRGAIQVPPSGEPIVLGPDHPTTGGYPVIATVVRGHLGSLGGRRAGARVQFVT